MYRVLCECPPHMCAGGMWYSTCEDQKKVHDSLEPELQAVATPDMDAGTLRKSGKSSSLPSRPSRPLT